MVHLLFHITNANLFHMILKYEYLFIRFIIPVYYCCLFFYWNIVTGYNLHMKIAICQFSLFPLFVMIDLFLHLSKCMCLLLLLNTLYCTAKHESKLYILSIYVHFFSVPAYRSFHLTASFFETGAMTTPTKLWTPIVLGLGVRLVPNSYTLAGFAIGTLHLATIAILHLGPLHTTNSFSPKDILISC